MVTTACSNCPGGERRTTSHSQRSLPPPPKSPIRCSTRMGRPPTVILSLHSSPTQHRGDLLAQKLYILAPDQKHLKGARTGEAQVERKVDERAYDLREHQSDGRASFGQRRNKQERERQTDQGIHPGH